MLMPGRGYNSPDYRYGFNGQEKDDEVSGSGNSMTAEFWQYDSRLGKRWNNDPIVKPWESPYATFGGNPILFSDPFGLDKDIKDPNGNSGLSSDGISQSDDKKMIFNDPNRSTKGADQDWDYGTWNEDNGRYEYGKYTQEQTSSSNPRYQEGTLWKTDQGQQAIFPKSTTNLGSGWSYGGSGIFNTSGRTNMAQIMKDHPGTAQFYMPRTKQAAQMEEAFQSGGRDAVIGLGAAAAAPFAVGYGSAAFGFANQRLAIWYLSRVGQLGNFSSVTGFSIGFGNVAYRYAPTLSNAFGRWSTSINYTAQEAYIYLALNYPGSIHTVNNIQFQLMRFGIYVNGVAASQGGLNNGGGQQFMRVIGTDVITK